MKLELYYFMACPFCQMVLNKVKSLGLEDKITYKDIASDASAREFHIQTTGTLNCPLFIY